jgi:methionine-rich copper-binding protein CopC
VDSKSQTAGDEISQLRARIAALEEELTRRDLRRRADELETELARSTGRSGGYTDVRRRRSTEAVGGGRRVQSAETDVSQSGQGTRPDVQSRQTARSSSTGSPQDLSIRDASARATDTLNRTTEEGRRLLRGLTLASLEPLRVAADVFGSFVDDVYSRNRASVDAPVQDLVTNLPGDIYNGFVNAVSRTFDVVPNTIDTFHESYHEGSVQRAQRRAATTNQEPHVVATTPISGSTSPAPTAVTVTFDSSIQPSNQDFSDAVVVKKDAAVVAGSTALSGRDTLVWTPNQPLAVGTYAVRVLNVESVADGYVVPMQTPYIFTFVLTSANTSGSARP